MEELTHKFRKMVEEDNNLKELVKKDKRLLNIKAVPLLNHDNDLKNQNKNGKIKIPYSKKELDLVEEYFSIISAIDDIEDAYKKSTLPLLLTIKDVMNGKLYMEKEGFNIEKNNKPKAPIIGADGNVFNLIGICRKTLKDAGLKDQAVEMTKRVTSSKSYEEALAIMMEYVDPIGEDYDMFDDYEMDIDI